jgi:hypothetical protein
MIYMKKNGTKVHVNLILMMIIGLLLSPTLTIVVSAEANTETFDVSFTPDDRLTADGGYVADTGVVNIYNVTGGLDDESLTLNIETWDEQKDNGTYSGAVYSESYLELDFVGREHEGALPYSYAAVGSYVNWSAQTVVNGVTSTTVRLPWVQEQYEFITLSLWEVDDMNVNMTVDAMENGTRANISDSNAVKVYQTYWGFDWWSIDGYAGTHDSQVTRYHFPDEFDQFPWSLDAVPGAINHCDYTNSWSGKTWCVGAGDVSSFMHPNAYILNGDDGCPDDTGAPGRDGGCLPISFEEGRKEYFDIEYSGERYYADVHHFIDPDQMYFIATTAILKNQTKPIIALTEESTNGGNTDSIIAHGLLDNGNEKWEEVTELNDVELGWSFIFTGGQGAGVTGVEIPARFNQTVWFQAELEPAEEFQNVTVTLPLLYEGTEPFHYCYVAYGFDADGQRVNWTVADPGGATHPPDAMGGDYPISYWDWSHGAGHPLLMRPMMNGCMGQRSSLNDYSGSASDMFGVGSLQQDLHATDFIKFTIGMVPCESWNYLGSGADGCTENTVYSYTPDVGTKYYTIGITLNPYMWCWQSDTGVPLAHPECDVGEAMPRDCNLPAGTDFCYEGPHKYRLMGHDGDAGFMVSDTILGRADALATLSYINYPTRIGGSTYSYNLAVSVQYTEGHWVVPVTDYEKASDMGIYDYRTSVASGNEMDGCFLSTSAAQAGKCHNLFEISDQYWAQVDWKDPDSWSNVLLAMKYMIAGFMIDLWNGMKNMDGTLMGGFVHSIEAVAELGHWLYLNLPKIVETIVNASVWILDNVDLILETMLIGLGAWLFYFGLRAIMLIVSHIKLSILRGPFE